MQSFGNIQLNRSQKTIHIHQTAAPRTAVDEGRQVEFIMKGERGEGSKISVRKYTDVVHMEMRQVYVLARLEKIQG